MEPVIGSGEARQPEADPSIDVDARAAEAFAVEFLKREGADASALAELLSSSDDTTLLYALQILTRDGQIEIGKEGIKSSKEQVQQLFAQIREAIHKAEQAAKHKGFFGALFSKFGAVAKIAVLVAAVASVVATGGGSLVAIAALAGTLLSSYSKELSKLAGGSALVEKMFHYGGMGLSLAAGGAGIAQGLAASGGAAANMGVRTAAEEIASNVVQGATYVQAGATAGQAGTGLARDEYAASELDARADEKEWRADRGDVFRQMDHLIEFLKDVDRSFSSSAEALKTVIDLESASNMTLANMGVRA